MNVFKIVLTILSSLNLYSQAHISFPTLKVENKQEVKKEEAKKDETKKEEKKEAEPAREKEEAKDDNGKKD